ncbi:LPS translocon maturation chaperone LptM [Bartonella sp. CB175]|uniref:LPS translocon maturation chaperone LptM n=1 Tax=Bartonella sp. CB175 TaxID=3112256 RepID=UPI00300DD094
MGIILKSLMIFLFCSVICAGCGRKGALELPSSDAIKTPKGAFASKSTVDKSFILDRLIQ